MAKYSADRVRTTGAVWLGSTLGCAECHDHKFDPFTARDFYSFAAFFADIKEQGIVRNAVHIEKLPVPTPEQSSRREELLQKLRAAEEKFLEQTPELRAAREQWEREIQADTERWSVLKPDAAESKGGATLKVLEDDSVLASGPNPDRDVYTLHGTLDRNEITPESINAGVALRLELLPDKSLPRSGPGRAGNGNLVLHSVEMKIAGRLVTWTDAIASHSQVNHSPEYVINGHKHGWAILPRTGQPLQIFLLGQLAESVTANDSSPTGPVDFEVSLTQNHGSGHNIGHFRLSLTPTDASGSQRDQDPQVAAEGQFSNRLISASESIRNLVAIPKEDRNRQQNEQLETAFRDATPLLKEVRDRLARLKKEEQQLQKSIVTTLATTATKPRAIRVLPRGDWMDDSGEVVEPAVPAFLRWESALDDSNDAVNAEADRLTRLDLARWLTARENPLVARTFVNRLWMLMFGNGLARNVDDLGSQGEPPTHPELLDWLAMEFIESGWDVKHMVRLMATSETYKQSSRASESLATRDPYNRLYGRQSRWRLDAEMIRDSALAVSGLLNRQIGGVSAKPYQPAGYWGQLNFPRRTYQSDRGSNQFRRGLYTHWQRTFLHPSLVAFDAPPREECTAQRSRSNTPLQSLVLLNDPTFVEAARVLATKAMQHEASGFRPKLKWVMKQALMREPRADEITLLQDLYEADLEIYRANPEDARQLLSLGETPSPDSISAVDLAAWTSVTRAVLNLHESITRY